MQYEVIIIELSHLTLNQKLRYRRSELGKHVMGGLVIKPEDINDDDPDIYSEFEDFVENKYYCMLDSALFFSDGLMKKMLAKENLEINLTNQYMYFDASEFRRLLSSFNKITLLVEEIEVNDWREDKDSEEEAVDPDSWEYILKVLKVY